MSDANLRWRLNAEYNPITTPTWAELRDALLAVLDIHQKAMLPGGQEYCEHCWNTNSRWPCATVRAINKSLGMSDE